MKKIGHQGSYASLPRPVPINEPVLSSRDAFLPEGVRIKPRPASFVPCTFPDEPVQPQPSAMSAQQAHAAGLHLRQHRVERYFQYQDASGEWVNCKSD
jgi:hypothetical protein